MRKDGGNMKTILKKYYLPVIIGVVAIISIIVLRLIHNVPFNYNEIGILIFAFASTLLVRTSDDLFDYKQDQEKGKKVIPYKGQLAILIILLVTIAINSFVAYRFIGLLLGAIYVLITGYAHKSNGILKMFIYPILLMISFIMMFNIYSGMFIEYTSYAYMGSIILVATIASIIFKFIKKDK